MNKKLIASSVLTVLLSMPAVILAFNPGPIPSPAPGLNIGDLVDIVFGILWPVAVAFFIVMFVIAAFKFFTAQGDPEQIKVARSFVIWGVVGVVVALLAWSIPFIVRNTLGSGI
ncbi:MAG: hypothetical protein AAB340_01985 [Patescibacteria group bacterium]